MRRRTRSSLVGTAAAVATAVTLAACSAGSPPEPGTASEPAFSTFDPVARADAEPDAAVAVDPELTRLASCESGLLDAFSGDQPQRGMIDDQVQVYEALQMLLPTAPTCGISYLQDDGRRSVVMGWFDAPETGTAVVDGLEAQEWSATAAPAAGYDMTTLSDGSTSVEVHPMGRENRTGATARLWDGIDVTLITVLLP